MVSYGIPAGYLPPLYQHYVLSSGYVERSEHYTIMSRVSSIETSVDMIAVVRRPHHTMV